MPCPNSCDSFIFVEGTEILLFSFTNFFSLETRSSGILWNRGRSFTASVVESIGGGGAWSNEVQGQEVPNPIPGADRSMNVNVWMFKTSTALVSSAQPSSRARASLCPSTLPVDNQGAGWQTSVEDMTGQRDVFSVSFWRWELTVRSFFIRGPPPCFAFWICFRFFRASIQQKETMSLLTTWTTKRIYENEPWLCRSARSCSAKPRNWRYQSSSLRYISLLYFNLRKVLRTAMCFCFLRMCNQLFESGNDHWHISRSNFPGIKKLVN